MPNRWQEGEILKSFKEEGGITNSKGHIRLNKVRAFFDNQIKGVEYYDFDLLKWIYEKWVKDKELMVFYDEIDDKFIFNEVAKRGNKAYKRRLYKKFKNLSKWIEEENKKRQIRDRGILKTNILFMTLTYDTGRCDINTAWKNIGREYHNFITALKKRYGKIEFIRVFEGFKNGYPHLHVLLIFKEKYFRCFKWKKKFRIARKREIEPLWHSFIDVEAVLYDNIKKAISYIMKYILKTVDDVDLEDDNTDNTLPLTWFYRKRQYGLSKGFYDLITKGLIETEIFESKGEYRHKYHFVGLIGMDEMEKVKNLIDKYELMAYMEDEENKIKQMFYDILKDGVERAKIIRHILGF